MNATPQDYLTNIYNSYARGRARFTNLIIKVSPELYTLYEATLNQNTRFVDYETANIQPTLAWRANRLVRDENLTGINVWIGTEDEWRLEIETIV